MSRLIYKTLLKHFLHFGCFGLDICFISKEKKNCLSKPFKHPSYQFFCTFQHYLKDKGPEHLLLFDLIEKMLDYNPSSRITLFDACRHQFFQSIHIKEPKERRPGFPMSYPDMPLTANGNGNQELRQHGSRETDPIVIDESSCESESKFEHLQPRDREVDREAFKR